MKKTFKAVIGITLCSLSAASFAQSYTGYPDIPGSAVGTAAKIMSYSPGTGVSSDRQQTETVLGAPDFYTQSEHIPFSLGNSGNIVLSFYPYSIKPSGSSEADVYVYEEGAYDSWDAYVSNDQENWTKLTAVFSDVTSTDPDNVDPTRGSVVGYDVDLLSSTASYKYLKIVDTSNTTDAPTAGSDIDAVVVTSAQYSVGGTLVDTDSRNSTVYNLEKDQTTGAIDVKKISKDGSVQHIMFSDDDSLDPIALSVQGNFDCDDEKDINVLATRKSDGVQLNIIKDQAGNDITTIDNSVVTSKK